MSSSWTFITMTVVVLTEQVTLLVLASFLRPHNPMILSPIMRLIQTQQQFGVVAGTVTASCGSDLISVLQPTFDVFDCKTGVIPRIKSSLRLEWTPPRLGYLSTVWFQPTLVRIKIHIFRCTPLLLKLARSYSYRWCCVWWAWTKESL